MGEMRREDHVPVYLSYGGGVESSCLIVRWLLSGLDLGFDLARLTLVMAQTGHEHRSTKQLVETYLFPLLRRFRIRFVQVARAGKYERDGFVVLEDTREPYILHTRPTPEKPYWTLRDETGSAGTVVQLGGTHVCAIKFKTVPIEAWLAEDLASQGDAAHRHAWGYNADETARVLKSEQAIAKRAGLLGDHALAFGYNVDETRRVAKSEKSLAKRRGKLALPVHAMAFGFNADETRRYERASAYDGVSRLGMYPLVDWGYTRQMALDHLFEVFGVVWEKSACVQCCFDEALSKATSAGLDRFEEDEDEAIETIVTEYVSMAFNKRGTMFATKSLRSLLVANGRHDILGKAFDRMFGEVWAIYRLRRLRNAPKPGKAKRSTPRCVEIVDEGSFAEMRERFAAGVCTTDAAALGVIDVEEKAGITYAWVHKPHPEVLPTREEFYVIAPRRVEDKVRGKLSKFNERWDQFRPSTGGAPQLSLFDSAA